MTKEELIAAIRVLTGFKGVSLKEIEKTLSMPTNYLSGMLNGSKSFAPKWQTVLAAYVEATTKGAKEIVIPIGPQTPVEDQVKKKNTPTAKKRIIKERNILTEPIPAQEYPLTNQETLSSPSEKESKTPPPDLTKAQQLRWHRENNQTLK